MVRQHDLSVNREGHVWQYVAYRFAQHVNVGH